MNNDVIDCYLPVIKEKKTYQEVKCAGEIKKLDAPKHKYFNINQSVKELDGIIGGVFPRNECYKLISYSGGFSSISFIKCVAIKEPIIELTASTLRIGEKQLQCLEDLHRRKMLDNANYFIDSMMANVDKNRGHGKYDYYARFLECCKNNEWNCTKIRNHSKIILMRTAKNYYIVETSSNLNENPQIEQYSFENSIELYEFYYKIFMSLK